MHEDRVPWHHAAISGFVLDPERKKMSKSKGNVVTPIPLVEQYGADSIRYWAGSARLGVDAALDEQVFKVGKRLSTKLFNAGKFVLSQTAEVRPLSCELDRAFAAELRALAERATGHFEAYDEAHALAETESFFWTRFTDTYLELAKAAGAGRRTRRRAARPSRGSASGSPCCSGSSRRSCRTSPRRSGRGPSRRRRATRRSTARRGPARRTSPASRPRRTRGASSSRSTPSPRSTRRRPTARCRQDARWSASPSRRSRRPSPGSSPCSPTSSRRARCADHRLEERRALEPGAFAVAAIEFAARAEG